MGTIPTMHQVDTAFLRRLRSRDEQAWFELWEAFGPVVRGTLARWGNGRLGEETLRDLTQDTLVALSDSIDRFDPQRGVRFSTWLLAIAKHVFLLNLWNRHVVDLSDHDNSCCINSLSKS